VKRLTAVLAVTLGGCFADLDTWPVATTPSDLDPMALSDGAFDGTDDRDGDCIRDGVEHEMARWFRPIFLFDTRENARRTMEPVVLYQAHPLGARGACGAAPSRVELTFAYLFRDDGGYVTSTFCGDRHAGDDQYLRAVLEVSDHGRRAALVSLWNWGYRFPDVPMRVMDREHPMIFLSAGKHHPFFDSRASERASPYSSWRCVDGVDGRGAMIVPTLESAAAPRLWLNVGESDAHPDDTFVNALDALGFAGELAWSTEAFCGGRPRSGCDGNNPLHAIWN
jgi:hypothetical protein